MGDFKKHRICKGWYESRIFKNERQIEESQFTYNIQVIEVHEETMEQFKGNKPNKRYSMISGENLQSFGFVLHKSKNDIKLPPLQKQTECQ